MVLSDGLRGNATQRTKPPSLGSVSIPELGQQLPQEGGVGEPVRRSLVSLRYNSVQSNELALTMTCAGAGEVGVALIQGRVGMNSRKGGEMGRACVLSLLLGLNLSVGYIQHITMYVKRVYDPENVRTLLTWLWFPSDQLHH